MSTIKSSDEHLTLNADGSSKDIKFQANGVEKASISSAGAFTSTTIDATKLTGALPAIDGSNLTGIAVNAVTGNLTVSGNITAGNNGSVFLLDNAGQKSGQIETDSSAANALNIDADPDNSAADSYTAFRIDNSEKFRITADGRGKSQFTIAAWVNFNGTGTVAIRDSHNVSSMGDWGTGQYGIYFTSGFSNSNYAYASMAQDSRIVSVERDNGKPDGSRLDVSCERSWDAALTDNETLSVLVIGDQA